MAGNAQPPKPSPARSMVLLIIIACIALDVVVGTAISSKTDSKAPFVIFWVLVGCFIVDVWYLVATSKGGPPSDQGQPSGYGQWGGG